jgi:hypothetical protein
LCPSHQAERETEAGAGPGDLIDARELMDAHRARRPVNLTDLQGEARARE